MATYPPIAPSHYYIDGPSAEKKYQMLSLIQRAHAGQTRNAGLVPCWVHCQSVAETLAQGLAETHELASDPVLLTDIYLGAQGHDLYEDTTTFPSRIIEQFGPRVHDLIERMTNPDGDRNRARYVARMRHAPEEVRLIKLADLIDNTMSCAYGVHDVGAMWVRQFFLPIETEMQTALSGTSFIRYPKTSRWLLQMLEFSRTRLRHNTAKFELIDAQAKSPAGGEPHK